MKVMIFEWLTSGGLWVDQIQPDLGSAIQSQGAEMLAAIVADFLQADVEVMLPIDCRLTTRFPPSDGLTLAPVDSGTDILGRIARLARDVDYVLLIAPESDSRLLSCVRSVNCGRRLISPDAAFVEIASNKQSTFDYLQRHGFDSFPVGGKFSDFRPKRDQFPLPAVLKPIDGSGSEEVQLVEDWASWSPCLDQEPACYRLEHFVRGTPISVSVICHSKHREFLVPTIQVFDREPFGTYIGAKYPVEPVLAGRATRLAQRAMDAMPRTFGYVGIDLVISDQDESFDSLIEINPRLTMSYLSLRKIYSENLAMKMLPA